MSRLVEPLSERSLQNQRLLLPLLGGHIHREDVFRRVLFRRRGGNLDGFARGGSADVDGALFDGKDPEGEDAVDERVEGYCDGGVELCGLEAELVVPEEAGCCEGEGGEAEGQTDVG